MTPYYVMSGLPALVCEVRCEKEIAGEVRGVQNGPSIQRNGEKILRDGGRGNAFVLGQGTTIAGCVKARFAAGRQNLSAGRLLLYSFCQLVKERF